MGSHHHLKTFKMALSQGINNMNNTKLYYFKDNVTMFVLFIPSTLLGTDDLRPL